MSTHNICFYGEIRKIIPELSSDTPPLQVLCPKLCYNKPCYKEVVVYYFFRENKTLH